MCANALTVCVFTVLIAAVLVLMLVLLDGFLENSRQGIAPPEAGAGQRGAGWAAGARRTTLKPVLEGSNRQNTAQKQRLGAGILATTGVLSLKSGSEFQGTVNLGR